MWIKQEHNINSLNFAKDVYKFLKKQCYLTENQVIGLNKWIVYMKNIPEINDKWFLKKKNIETDVS